MRWVGPLLLASVLVACGLELAGERPSSVDDEDASSPSEIDADGQSTDAHALDDADGAASDVALPLDTGVDGPTTKARRKPITIAAGKVTAALADFPLWIDLVDADLGVRAEADGSDIFFTTADGSPLPYQIQRWNKAGPRLSAWVRVSLANAAATTIYVRYGEKVGAPAPAPATVFSSGFRAVWHLEDTLAAPSIADTTGVSAGTAVGLVANQQQAAKLGGGIAFNGNASEITFTNPISGNSPHTISLWVQQAATTDNDALVVLGNATCGQSRWFHSRFDGATLAVGFYCSDWSNPAVNVIGAGWTLLHWVFEGTNNTSRLYRNGAQVAGPFTHAGTATATTGTGGHIGNAPGGFGQNMGVHATLDEVRIANVARSAAWVAAEYANQNAPTTFYAVGPEQLAP